MTAAGRVLADASSLVALARIGALCLLKDLFGTVHTTEDVRREATLPGYPGAALIEAAVADGWLQVLRPPPAGSAAPEGGLGRGEWSLLARSDINPDADVLVLDDVVTRRHAEARGLRRVGVLGVLVASVEEGVVTKAEAITFLDRLAGSDFRMTAELYAWARARVMDGE